MARKGRLQAICHQLEDIKAWIERVCNLYNDNLHHFLFVYYSLCLHSWIQSTCHCITFQIVKTNRPANVNIIICGLLPRGLMYNVICIHRKSYLFMYKIHQLFSPLFCLNVHKFLLSHRCPIALQPGKTLQWNVDKRSMKNKNSFQSSQHIQRGRKKGRNTRKQKKVF